MDPRWVESAAKALVDFARTSGYETAVRWEDLNAEERELAREDARVFLRALAAADAVGDRPPLEALKDIRGRDTFLGSEVVQSPGQGEDRSREDRPEWDDVWKARERAETAEAEVTRLRAELEEARAFADSTDNPLWDRAWAAGESRAKAGRDRLRARCGELTEALRLALQWIPIDEMPIELVKHRREVAGGKEDFSPDEGSNPIPKEFQ